MDSSKIFRLNLSDLWKGLVSAVLGGAVLAGLAVVQGVFSAPDFNVLTVDWAGVGIHALNAAIVGAEGAFTGYLAKNLFSDSKGNLFGRIKL